MFRKWVFVCGRRRVFCEFADSHKTSNILQLTGEVNLKYHEDQLVYFLWKTVVLYLNDHWSLLLKLFRMKDVRSLSIFDFKQIFNKSVRQWIRLKMFFLYFYWSLYWSFNINLIVQYKSYRLSIQLFWKVVFFENLFEISTWN